MDKHVVRLACPDILELSVTIRAPTVKSGHHHPRSVESPPAALSLQWPTAPSSAARLIWVECAMFPVLPVTSVPTPLTTAQLWVLQVQLPGELLRRCLAAKSVVALSRSTMPQSRVLQLCCSRTIVLQLATLDSLVLLLTMFVVQIELGPQALACHSLATSNTAISLKFHMPHSMVARTCATILHVVQRVCEATMAVQPFTVVKQMAHGQLRHH